MDIVQLIKGLSQSEKRHFARSAQQKSPKSNRYMELYYQCLRYSNETELLKSENWKHFPQLKAQLKDRIFQVLRQFHRKGSKQSILMNELHTIQLISDKGYLNESIKRLRELNKSTLVGNHTASIFKSLLDSRTLYSLTEGNKIAEMKVLDDEWDQNTDWIIKRFKSQREFEKKYLEINLLKNELESARTHDERSRIESFLGNLCFLKPEFHGSILAELYYHYSKGVANYLLGDYEKTYEEMFRAKMLCQDNPLLIEGREELFLRILANCALSGIQLGKEAEVEFILLELSKLTTKSVRIKLYADYLLHVLVLMKLVSIKQYEFAVQLINRTSLNKQLNSFAQSTSMVSQESTYELFSSVAAYLGTKDYKRALKKLNKYLAKKKTHPKRDAYVAARVLFLVVLIELEDETLLHSELQSIHLHLKKNKDLFLFEKIFLNFSKTIMTTNLTSEFKSAYIQFYKDLQALKMVPIERNALVYFDFIGWVEKKLKPYSN